MNPYELILIFDPRLGDEKISQVVGKIEDKIKAGGGEIEKTEKWGTRMLASMVRKVKNLTQGYYVFVKFNGLSTLPGELKANLKVNESVIRYFIARAEVLVAAPQEEKEIAGAPLGAPSVAEIKGEPLGESK